MTNYELVSSWKESNRIKTFEWIKHGQYFSQFPKGSPNIMMTKWKFASGASLGRIHQSALFI